MTEVVQTKRGRKKASENAESVTPVPKKRGRKPRGGKLVVRNDDLNNTPQMVTSIILNLKCSLKDLDSNQQISDTLKYDPSVPPTVESYQNNAFDYSIYNNINENESKQTNNSEQIFDNEKISFFTSLFKIGCVHFFSISNNGNNTKFRLCISL